MPCPDLYDVRHTPDLLIDFQYSIRICFQLCATIIVTKINHSFILKIPLLSYFLCVYKLNWGSDVSYKIFYFLDLNCDGFQHY